MTSPILALAAGGLLPTSVFGLSLQGAVALGFVVVVVALFAVALLSLEGMRRVSLRRIPAYDSLKKVVAEAAETGETIHLSAGTGSVGASSTAETLAGITALSIVMGRAATSRVSTLLTTASPIVLPIMQAIAERSYTEAAAPSEHDPTRVRFAGDDRGAYAVAVSDNLEHERVGASLLLGSLGDETLYIGERSREAGVTQFTGTASTRALPYAMITADHVLVGEDMYASGAYLANQPAHVASLLAQDWLRVIVVGAILAGVLLKTLGLL